MNDNDALLGGETINADSLGIEKTSFFNKKNKKYFIIGGISIAILVLIIVVIILAIRGSSNSGKEHEEQRDLKNAIGEINAEYFVSSITAPTTILSSEFEDDSSFSIYIDEQFVKFTKKYTFKERSTNQKVKFVIFDEINMNKMFKGVKELNLININSEKNMRIKSLESAFENCERLTQFQMSGCDASSITSVKNIFRNAKITDLSNAISSFNGLKDISYLFAGLNLKELDLSNLKTDNVENMSGLFKDSQSLNSINDTKY
jgi:surface protein